MSSLQLGARGPTRPLEAWSSGDAGASRPCI